MEESRVIAIVGPLEDSTKLLVYVFTVLKITELPVCLDAPILRDTQENDAVDDSLNCEVQFSLRQTGVPYGDVRGQFAPPLFNLVEKGVIDLSSSPFELGRCDELVKKALENSVLGKRADNVVPVFDILLVREKQDTSCRCLISLERLNSAVVRSEFAEVRLGAIVEASKTKRNGEAEKLMAHLP